MYTFCTVGDVTALPNDMREPNCTPCFKFLSSETQIGPGDRIVRALSD